VILITEEMIDMTEVQKGLMKGDLMIESTKVEVEIEAEIEAEIGVMKKENMEEVTMQILEGQEDSQKNPNLMVEVVEMIMHQEVELLIREKITLDLMVTLTENKVVETSEITEDLKIGQLEDLVMIDHLEDLAMIDHLEDLVMIDHLEDLAMIDIMTIKPNLTLIGDMKVQDLPLSITHQEEVSKIQG
jgi:hypothetical protein